jgi:Kef-type K+ transport system membrane component KefB/nucleotide-binding universal stress UspA family protein
MTLPSLSNHLLLTLWVELTALLVAGRLLGAAARRVSQPAVVGELLAGLLLGPSVLGHLWPAGFRWFLPRGSASYPLLAITQLSLLILLVVIGAETDLRLIRRLGGAATSVSAVSLLVPLAAGAAVAVALPAGLAGHRGGEAAFVLLMAGAIGVSSLPVIAKIVTDMGLVRRDMGQLAISAGTAHDATGFLLVAVATGLAASGGGSVSRLAVALVGLLVVAAGVLTAGQRLFDSLLRRVRRGGPNVSGSLGISVAGSLGAAAAMQAVGVEGALGAFVAGVALGRSRFQQSRALGILEITTTTFFSPIYFASAGLRVDLGTLGHASAAISFAVVLAVAATAKYAGSVAGGRLARLHWRECSALGVALNGRGALQVIIGTAGLGAGILDPASYTIIILMSLVTSVATPPLLRAATRNWRGTAAEQERLQREEQLERNVIVRGQRILLPSRGSPNSILAAEVVGAAWPHESEVTIISIGEPGHEPDVRPVVEVLNPRVVEHRRVASERVLEEMVAEAQLGYGAIAVGAADEPQPQHLLSAVLDDLLIRSPIPVVVVRRARRLTSRLPPAFASILVPVTGTASSRAGQEVACSMSRALGTQVVLTHVVTRTDADELRPQLASAGARARQAAESRENETAPGPGYGGPPAERRSPAADGGAEVVLRGAVAMATEMGIDPEVMVRHGRSAGDEIVAAIGESGADAVALGTTVRQVEGHPFLGHTVEQVLTQADASVIVVVLPDSSSRLGAMVAEMSGQS